MPSPTRPSVRRTPKLIVLGVGNPILGDDAAGIRVAELVESRLKSPEGTEIVKMSDSGLHLVERMQGYAKAIIIDSIVTEEGKIGRIHRMTPEQLQADLHPSHVHSIHIAAAYRLVQALDSKSVPKDVVVYAVEIGGNLEFSERLTPQIEKASRVAARRILNEIGTWQRSLKK